MVDLGEGEELLLSEQNACPHCESAFPELSPALFSFNCALGMCPDCNGLGTQLEVDPGLIVEHPGVSLLDGASRWFGNVRKKGRAGTSNHLQHDLAEHYGVDLELPWKDLPQKFRDVILYGSGEEKIHFKYENEDGSWKGETNREERGIVYHINRLFRQTKSEYTRRWYMQLYEPAALPGLRRDAPVRRGALRHRGRQALRRSAGDDHRAGLRLGARADRRPDGAERA